MKRSVALAAAAIAAVASTASGSATTPQARIVFAADRAPSVSGEIYRLDPNGHRVDLSRSPYEDTDPVVSSDGKRVAFLSNRSGREGVYEVGIDGRGLVRVARSLRGLSPGVTSLAWQPHGHLLAVETIPESSPEGRVWIVPPHGKPTVVSSHFGIGLWSPDGGILLVWAGDGLRAVTPSGQSLWTTAADQPTGTWSRQGLLAVPVYHGGAVYDERGHRLFRFPLPTSNATFSWSPDGRRLAVLWSGTSYELEVRAPNGRLLLEKAVAGGDMAWADNSEVIFGYPGPTPYKTVGVDVRTGKVSQASNRWLDPLSPDRKLAIVTPAHKPGFSLGVAAAGGGAAKAYRQVGGCSGDGVWMPAVSSPQFVGSSRSLVYQSWGDCDAPFANLYAVAPGGGAAKRLTHVQAQETLPSVSPNGSEIAYVWADANGLSCKGCSDGIRIASAAGKALRTLTNPQDCTFDDSPTWSPDGKTILFARSNCGSRHELYTVPAAGGRAQNLRVGGGEPAWGPQKIAYVHYATRTVWKANPNGTDRVRVGKGSHPAWSTDGRLAYLTGHNDTTLVVGKTRENLPFVHVTSLAWSRDGTRFVVTARRSNTAAPDVYTVRANGTHPVRLTKNYDASSATSG